MNTVALPIDWNTDSLFPSLESTEFAHSRAQLQQLVERFATTLESSERKGDTAALEAVIREINEIYKLERLVGGYVALFITTDSKNDLAQAISSELETQLLPLEKLATRMSAWIGGLDLDPMIAGSTFLASHEFTLRKIHLAAQHLMSPTEETLATDLAPSGISAWQKLHGNVNSQLSVTVELPSGVKSMPMSAVRALAYDPDREVRRSAYEAELAAWKATEVPIAAAMNSMKGAVEVLSRRRGWGTPLDAAIFSANIDRETLEAMLAAAHEAFPDMRRYLKAKARALKIDRLAFYDIFAPLEGGSREWSYESGSRFVTETFGGYSSKLANYAKRAFDEGWIDVYPKPGKRDGAFCMGVRDDESRILMNFKSSFGAVSTLAHELGHGYHNLCLAERTPLQRRLPMTLAETASIFCETIIRQAGIANSDAADKLTILEASLQGSTQTIVDITSRFIFEQEVFNKRGARELSATELCEIMLDAQRQTYGGGLDGELLHSYMWAAKPHYYSARSYYNFPYMFGLLFGLGLYAVYQAEPNGFHQRYDDLLSETGMADAATLASRFGIDIRSIDFWRASLDQVRADVDEFEKLIS